MFWFAPPCRLPPGPVSKPRGLAPAILFSSFHNAHKAADPVDLLAVRLAKLLEPSNQVFRGLAF